MIESGLPNFEAVGWYMVLVPARTEAKRFLETEVRRWGAVVKAAGLKSE